ncbi:MAG: MBL fold metallo-hydrolase RNA specificity domain-containing protein [Chloroflexota bacterium]
MKTTLRFLGAARNVTGSAYLVEAPGIRILVDCGLYQERELQSRNWAPFPAEPESIDAVFLTHAHLDHCGLLPKLTRDGFRGPVYCTAATAEIAEIMLLDSAHLQEQDADFKRRRHVREGRKGPYPEVPLYTTADVEACLPLFSPVGYGEEFKVGGGAWATFLDAGHVLGSGIVKFRLAEGSASRTIVFSGDLGRWDKAVMHDPTLVKEADYVVVESTYGDRLHESAENVEGELAAIIKTTVQAQGNVVIPSFALERAQEVLYHLNGLVGKKSLPRLPVFLDSPMAARVTDVYERYPRLMDEDTAKLIRHGDEPFDFPGLSLVATAEESKAINRLDRSAVIIAGSGMCTGGRVKHHLVNNIGRPESTILFVGYQAVGTLGRQIVDGAEQVRILGEMYPVRARVARIDGLSAHADRDELLRWLSGLARAPRQIFVVHGEQRASTSFASYVHSKTGWQTHVPRYLEQVAID